jgi:hypothetical protein
MATKELQPSDMADGLRSERTIQRAADAQHMAEHGLHIARQEQELLINHLRIVYGAPAERYELRDWTIGFEEKEGLSDG